MKGTLHIKSILCLLWLGVPAVSYGAEQAGCAISLSKLSWVLQKGGPYDQLNSDKSGAELHGVKCDEAEIINWFEANAWRHQKSVSPKGASFGGGSQEYRADRGVVFCLPRRFLFRLLTGGCSAQVSVLLFQGKITHLTAGPTL